MSLSRRTQQYSRRGPVVAVPELSCCSTDRDDTPPSDRPMLRVHDSTTTIEALVAAVQTTFEDALSAAVGDTPSTDALRACEALLEQLDHSLAETFVTDRHDVAVFLVRQYRLRFAKIFEQLCGLELSTNDELAVVSAVHVFSTYTGAIASKWPGTVLPPPLHDVGAVAPLMDRLSPFCEGYLLLRAPGNAWSWQRRWAVLDRGQLAVYSSQDEADNYPNACCLRISLSAVACVKANDSRRMLTLQLDKFAATARAAGCVGLTVTEQSFGSMDFRVDMAPDFKAWKCALSASQQAAALWSQFSIDQPQWSRLAHARSPRWTTTLGGTAETDVGAQVAAAASQQIGIYLPSQWWSILRSDVAEDGSLSVLLNGALQGMLCLLSNALWTRLVAPAGWYWESHLEKPHQSVNGEQQCNSGIATDVLALAHSEVLQQLSSAVSEVTCAAGYSQRPGEQARLSAWSMQMQCQAGQWCEGLSEALQPLHQSACWPILQGPAVLIHQSELPSPCLLIGSGLGDSSSWCRVDQWCIVKCDSAPTIPIPGGGTEMEQSRTTVLRCVSCLPSELDHCRIGDCSNCTAEIALPDGRYAIVFQGESDDLPAVLLLGNAELAKKWKAAIRDMQTSTLISPVEKQGQRDAMQELVEATQMAEELCIDLLGMYTASVTRQGEETKHRRNSTSSLKSQPTPCPEPASQISPPPIGAADYDSAVVRRACTEECTAEVQRAILGIFEDACTSHLPQRSARPDGGVAHKIDAANHEQSALDLVRWAEWYSCRMEFVASSLATAMNLDWGGKLRAAGPRLQATPAFSTAIDVSCSAMVTRLQATADAAMKRARVASTGSTVVVDGRHTHILWQELGMAAWREFEKASMTGCVRLEYNLARDIVGLIVKTAATCMVSTSSSGCDVSEEHQSDGHIDWVCTTVNSSISAWPFVSQLLSRFENVIPDPYRTQLDTNHVKIAFSNMGRDGVEWLVSVVVKDIKTVLRTSASRWPAQVDGEDMEMAMAAVVATIADYFDDFAPMLVRKQLEMVAEGVATGFAHVYLECLLRDPCVSRPIGGEDSDAVAALTAKAVEGDLLLVLSALSTHAPRSRLNTALEPLRSVAALLIAPIVPAERFGLEFDRLCRRHWGSNGISFALAERVLDLRRVSDGVLSRAKTNARTACEQRLAAHWSCMQLVVAPVPQSVRNAQETDRRRRINWQARGCDTFCHSCAGPASSSSATHQLEQSRTPIVFELMEAELGFAEISTFAELELFREEVALAKITQDLQETQVEIQALQQQKEECVAARDMYTAELSDLTGALAALGAPSTPATGVARIGHATNRSGLEDSEIAGDDI